MAKKKNIETPETVDVSTKESNVIVESPIVASIENAVPGTIETPVEVLNETSPETVDVPTKEKKVEVDEIMVRTKNVDPITEIPTMVRTLLAAYPNYKALYVDTKGGVYPEGTQPNLIKEAILYQNPYYKQ